MDIIQQLRASQECGHHERAHSAFVHSFQGGDGSDFIQVWHHTQAVWAAPDVVLLLSCPGMDGQGRGAGPAKMFKVVQAERNDSTLFHHY